MIDGSTCISIAHLARRARSRVPGFVWDQIEGAAGDGGGAARNEEAFRSILFRARRLAGPLRSTGVELFGRAYAQPFGIAPMSRADEVWPGTDRAMAEVAATRRVPLVLSTGASSGLEDIVRIAGDMLWFQLYRLGTRAATADLLGRAGAAGIEVLVFTVDFTGERRWNGDSRTGRSGRFPHQFRLLLDAAAHPSWTMRRLLHGPVARANVGRYEPEARQIFPAPSSDDGLTWEDVRFVRDLWKGRLVLKGLMLPEDAIEAVKQGADGVWISNHGGRQLDSLPATVTAIPAIRAALGPGTPILLDSGIRNGESVLKALALGADFAFAGRPFLYGAGALGPNGVRQAFDILASEVRIGLKQVGCPTPRDLDARWIMCRD